MEVRNLLGLTLLAVLVAPGCVGACETREQLSAVWADDDSAYAILVRTFETRPGILWEERDYVESQLFIEDLKTQLRTPVTAPLEDAESFDRLYFMRSAGYLLYPALVVERGRFYRRVDLDGSVREVPGAVPLQATSCPNMELIPSPDGARLAELRTWFEGCETGVPTSTTVTAEVRFLDASSFGELGSRSRFAVQTLPRATWTPAGSFLVVSESWLSCNPNAPSCVPTPCLEALAIDPVLGASSVEPPGCLEPPTRSSPISSRGVTIAIGADGAVATTSVAPVRAFGCQNRPASRPRCR